MLAHMLDTPMPVPLVADESGGLRLTGTRVTLDSILAAFEQGATPEEIALRFPSARLADLYTVIAWTLDRQAEVALYIRDREALRGKARAKAEANGGAKALRERLNRRRSADAPPRG